MTQKQTAASGPDTPMAKTAAHEEPELLLERNLPSDGPDEIGEAMIRNLPQKTKLAEPPSQPDASSKPA